MLYIFGKKKSHLFLCAINFAHWLQWINIVKSTEVMKMHNKNTENIFKMLSEKKYIEFI